MKQDCPVCNSTNTSKVYDPTNVCDSLPDEIELPDTLRGCDRCGSEWNCCDEITLDARRYYTDEENELLGRDKLDISK